MDGLLRWWRTGLSPWVKLVYAVLLANGVPAFIILMSIPGMTDNWFVWTVRPNASARLLGVMYGNALLLVGLGLLQPTWPRARITVVVISIFSVAATIVTLFHLDPFLRHPWFHLAYWLTMYLALFFLAPAVFYLQERAHGGRLPVEIPLSPLARAVAAIGAAACLLTGLGLLIDPAFVSALWPWDLTPLVGRIVGVWLSTLGIAYAWALWDGDGVRTKPIFVQAPLTGLLLALLPLLHSGEMRSGAGGPLTLFLALALGSAAANLFVLLTEQRTPVAEVERGNP